MLFEGTTYYKDVSSQKKKKKDVSSPQFNLFNTIPIEIPAGLFENNNFN